MQLRFTPSGRDDFLDIIEYIAQDRPMAALRFRERAEPLSSPKMQRQRSIKPSSRRGTRRLVYVSNLLDRYRVVRNELLDGGLHRAIEVKTWNMDCRDLPSAYDLPMVIDLE